MYSRKAWGGDVEPFILTKFNKIEEDVAEDYLVSLVVFEWGDEQLIGRPAPGGGDDVSWILGIHAKLV
jgi:hypothetical protein